MQRVMIPKPLTKTTAREEWSYIYIVLRELVIMSFPQSFILLWKKLWKING
jgi:hypothetical protein